MSLLIKFISDENIPVKLTELLKEKGFDVIKDYLIQENIQGLYLFKFNLH